MVGFECQIKIFLKLIFKFHITLDKKGAYCYGVGLKSANGGATDRRVILAYLAPQWGNSAGSQGFDTYKQYNQDENDMIFVLEHQHSSWAYEDIP